VDGSGNVYVSGYLSSNVFKIDPNGVVIEIIDASGDGAGEPFHGPHEIAVDESGNVYVGGSATDNAFKIDPNGAVTEIIDATGDGAGNPLDKPWGIAVDGSGNAYVPGFWSDNAFKIDPHGVVTEIIDETGDGAGNPLDAPWGIAADGSGNVYVSGYVSFNAFKIDPNGVVTEIIDATGDGAGNPLQWPREIAVDGSGNVYVSGYDSSNAFKIDPNGLVTEIIDASGDGAGNALSLAQDIAVDGSGNAYVTGSLSDNAFMIEFECGDGILDPGQQCDDGDIDAGDGCGSSCQVEAGFTCLGEPSLCTRIAFQTSDQRSCINGLNRSGAKVCKVQGEAAVRCVKNAGQGKTGHLGTPPTIQDCPTNDTKGRVYRAWQRTIAKETDRCDGPPDYGVTSAEVVNQAAIDEVLGIVEDLYGTDLGAAIVSAEVDEGGANCQTEVLKLTTKLFDAKWKVALKGKKNALQGEGQVRVQSAPQLQAAIIEHLNNDPRARIQKARLRLSIKALVECEGALSDIEQMFPGVCSGSADLAALASCADRIAECRFCRSLNAFDAFAIDCDDFDDDGLIDDNGINGSCP
jgi:cysteine-rich repeat protein